MCTSIWPLPWGPSSIWGESTWRGVSCRGETLLLTLYAVPVPRSTNASPPASTPSPVGATRRASRSTTSCIAMSRCTLHRSPSPAQTAAKPSLQGLPCFCSRSSQGQAPRVQGVQQVLHLHTQPAVHERAHTSNQPFTCPLCTKSFTQSNALASHHRVHSGQWPFCYTTCDKAFNHPT